TRSPNGNSTVTLTANGTDDVTVANLGLAAADVIVLGSNSAGSGKTFSLTTSPQPTSGAATGTITVAANATVAVAGTTGSVNLVTNAVANGPSDISQSDPLTTATLKAANITLRAQGPAAGDINIGTTNNGTSDSKLTAASTAGNVTVQNIG